MLRRNRAKIFCIKVLPNGITDSFTVVVFPESNDAAKKEYARQGYRVFA